MLDNSHRWLITASENPPALHSQCPKNIRGNPLARARIGNKRGWFRVETNFLSRSQEERIFFSVGRSWKPRDLHSRKNSFRLESCLEGIGLSLSVFLSTRRRESCVSDFTWNRSRRYSPRLLVESIHQERLKDFHIPGLVLCFKEIFKRVTRISNGAF